MNGELDELAAVLDELPRLLRTDGRVAVLHPCTRWRTAL